MTHCALCKKEIPLERQRLKAYYCSKGCWKRRSRKPQVPSLPGRPLTKKPEPHQD